MGIGNIIGGVASIGGALLGSRSASKAASAQERAAQSAQESQERIYFQQREDYEPFRQSGLTAQSALDYELGLGARPMIGNDADAFDPTYYLANNPDVAADAGYGTLDGARAHFERHGQTEGRMGNAQAAPFRGFQSTPGYAFQMAEGNRAVDASAASRGMLKSGQTIKAQTRFRQGVAAGEYSNYLTRLQGGQVSGQSATNALSALGSNFANQSGQNALAGGQARASGYAGVNNALQGGLNNLAYFGGRAFG